MGNSARTCKEKPCKENPCKGNPFAPGYGREWALRENDTNTSNVFDPGFLVTHKVDASYLDPSLVMGASQMRLCVKQHLFTFADTFKVKQHDGKPILEVRGAFLTLRGRVDVLDMKGKLIAVVLRRVFGIDRGFFVYAPKMRVDGQEKSSETGPEGEELYSWALVSTTTFECTVRPSLRMCMAIGDNTFGDVEYVGRKPAMCSYKMDITKNTKGCCRIDRARFKFECTNCYQLTVSAGIDPALMVCYTIIKDELDDTGGGAGCAAKGDGD